MFLLFWLIISLINLCLIFSTGKFIFKRDYSKGAQFTFSNFNWLVFNDVIWVPIIFSVIPLYNGLTLLVFGCWSIWVRFSLKNKLNNWFGNLFEKWSKK